MPVPTTFEELIVNPEAARIYLLEASPYDPSGSGEVDVYLSSDTFATEPPDTPSNQIYSPVLAQPFNYQADIFSRSRIGGAGSATFGAIRLPNIDGALDYLTEYFWGGRDIVIKAGGAAFGYGDFETVFTGKAESIEWSETEITIRIRDPRTVIEKDLQDDLYQGTGGLEGDASLEGVPKPQCYGFAREVDPVLLESVPLIYQVHDDSVENIADVYDAGFPLEDNGDFAGLTGYSGLDDEDLLADPLDGTKFWVTSSDGSDLYISEFETGIRWQVATSSFNGNEFELTDFDINDDLVGVSPEADKFYVKEVWTIFQYEASTPGNVSTVTYTSGDEYDFRSDLLPYKTETTDPQPDGFCMSPDGQYLVVSGNRTFVLYKTSTPYDISTISLTGDTFEHQNPADAVYEPITAAIWAKKDQFSLMGTRLIANKPLRLVQYDMDVPYDISNMALSGEFDLSVLSSVLDQSALQFSGLRTDGTILYVSEQAISGTLSQFFLDTPWDITTVSVAGFSSFDNDDGRDIRGIYIFQTSGNDGGPLYSGGYLTDIATGRFRLGANPSGRVTADVQGDNAGSGGYITSTSDIFQRVVTKNSGLTSGDLDSAAFTQLESDNGDTIGLYIKDEAVRLPDILTRLTQSIGAFWTFNRAGELTAAVFVEPGTPSLTLTESDIIPFGRLVRTSPGRPVYRVRLGYDKTWFVQEEGALAAILASDEKRLRSREYRYVTSEDSGLQSDFPSSRS